VCPQQRPKRRMMQAKTHVVIRDRRFAPEDWLAATGHQSVIIIIQTWHGVVIKAERDWRGVGRPQVAMHSQLPRYRVIIDV